MADFTFEGDMQGVNEKQKEFIVKILKERGFKNRTVTVSNVGKAGDNYVANVKRFAITKDGETFKMIAKIAPDCEAQRMMMNTKIMFHNEHIMYSHVLPKFTQLEVEAGIPENDRLRYAVCYGSYTEEPYEIILLEDLQVSDYVMLDRFKSFTDECVRLVLTNFAKLHSLSYALRYQEPEIFMEFSNLLWNPWLLMSNMPDVEKYFMQLESDVLELLEDEKDKKRIKGSMTKLPNYALQNSDFDQNSKYSVIFQGDSWTNNMMFKLNGDTPTECCMIDYQISNRSSPVADILYMIFNCTNHEIRSKHYSEWITHYHNELDRCLSTFGLNISEVYPREQLDSDLKRVSKFSFALSLMLATMLIRESDDAKDIQAAIKGSDADEILKMSKLDRMDKKTLNRFKLRLEGLIASFVELGYID